MCGPHQVWPLRSECCGRGVPTKVVCAECMKMCCLGGKNSVVKGLRASVQYWWCGGQAFHIRSEKKSSEVQATYILVHVLSGTVMK